MTNPNHQAFGHGDMYHCEGLTKREYFAAMAMEGVLSACPEGIRVEAISDKTLSAWASGSIRMADALIAELNKQP